MPYSWFYFDLVKNVLRDKKKYDRNTVIEKVRQELLKEKTEIEITDFGAGSAVSTTNRRTMADIARVSLKSKKYAQLLSRIVDHYKPQTILELGTSLGITTSYLAVGNPASKVYTIEGSPAIAEIARQTFLQTGLNNIELIEGEFGNVLPAVLNNMDTIDLVFIDGNHRAAPTLDYFQQLLQYSKNSTLLIFDDIHWSKEMEEAWDTIKEHPSVTSTIDLFFIGIVLLNPDFKTKQHFTIRF